MINPELFFKQLTDAGVDFYSGVPDSLLSDICAFITDNVNPQNHIISANEGNAVAIAVGYHLATDKIPLVYLQNSGIGNTINPILSIADDKVYGIPMLLMVGWRGEPGTKDEPQHIRQGEINQELLDAIKIPFFIIDNNCNTFELINNAIKVAKDSQKPVVLLVRKDVFSSYKIKSDFKTNFPLNRELALQIIIDQINEKDVVVSTTGKTSRELFEYRVSKGHSHEKDFLTVGGMGHTSSIALGIALAKQDRNVYCIDGDGSVLMHMGSMAINGLQDTIENFKHIVINNGAHDSVGGQPTVAFKIDLVSIAKSCGYTFFAEASNPDDIKAQLKRLANHKGRGFLEIKVNKGARQNLGRPTTSPKENKQAFKSFLLKK